MIYISKFRSNDLNPSRGKQIEFNKGVVESFFNFTNEEHAVEFECHSILDAELKEKIRVEFKLSPARGDYKIYQNRDGSRDLKDFLLDTLHLEIEKNINDYFAIKKQSPIKYILYYIPKDSLFSHFFSIASNDQVLFIPDEKEIETLDDRHQVIYYGAPGTGKSYKIKEKLEGVSKENIFRTTFHPDSDYSTFVGAYKPSRGRKPLYGLNGGLTVRLNDGEDLSEEMITYKFIPQAFLNAYMRAYGTTDNVYLVIEEINRGNCAQIFGDLFQLLDRDENGVSEYHIKADTDLRAYLEEELGADSDAIKDGELCLPSNLYIYATMNTSDQSLFPIDSAFKRRWDWEYEPIKYKNINWVIDIEGSKYLWTSFQREINKRIFDATNSEDKMLGDYFVNPTDGVITEKILLNKILFYLWNDVCKDGEGDIFKTADNEEVTFSDLHSDGGKDMLIAMMKYLKVQEIVEDTDTKEPTKRKNPKYSINNSKDSYSTPETVCHVIQEYAEQNQGKSVQEMIDIWNGISERNDCLVDSWAPSPNDKQPFANKRRSEIKWGDKSVWVTRGWTEEIFQTFIRNAKEQLGVIIEKVE